VYDSLLSTWTHENIVLVNYQKLECAGKLSGIQWALSYVTNIVFTCYGIVWYEYNDYITIWIEYNHWPVYILGCIVVRICYE